LFEDEFSLSNTATVHYQWGKKGKQPTISCKQRQRERQISAMGSYNFDTGQMTVTFHQKGNYQSFKRHLKKILKIYRHHSKIIMVVDNVRCKQRQRERQTAMGSYNFDTGQMTVHHAKLLKKWLINNTKLELVYLPPYSPELNPIERAWWYMRKKITHNRYVKTLKERKVVFWKMFSHFQQPNDELLRVCEINY
jgi:transposase